MTPTLSQVENWDTEHLNAAADHWSKTATVWEDRFGQYAAQVANPGGMPWQGDAAEAAYRRAHSDLLIVVGLADQLHDASAIARRGATQLQEACRLVMRSVESAQNDGFTVGEDFSVTDHHVYNRAVAALRQAKAEGYAADIRAAVAHLVATDERIAAEITTVTSGLGNDHFAESAAPPAAPGADQKAVADALLGNVAGKPPQTGAEKKALTEALLGNITGGGTQEQPLSDALLANIAGVGGTADDAAQSALYQIGKAALGEQKDWVFGVPTGYATVLLDGVSEAARPGTVGAPSWVQKTVGEIKMGKLPLGSVSGLSASGVGAGVSFLIDQNKPGMTTTHAAVKNGVALFVGTLASAPFDATVVGIPAGIVVGTGAGNLAGAGVDLVWEPMAKSQEIFSAAGGPGAAMKAARWGR